MRVCDASNDIERLNGNKFLILTQNKIKTVVFNVLTHTKNKTLIL